MTNIFNYENEQLYIFYYKTFPKSSPDELYAGFVVCGRCDTIEVMIRPLWRRLYTKTLAMVSAEDW